VSIRDEVRQWRMWLDWAADWSAIAVGDARQALADMTWGEDGELGESGA
jgi:hypothetical protein